MDTSGDRSPARFLRFSVELVAAAGSSGPQQSTHSLLPTETETAGTRLLDSSTAVSLTRGSSLISLALVSP